MAISEIDLAMSLIEQGDNYLLQLRNFESKKGAAGMIGCFGGQVESDESPQEAALRELMEETSLEPDIDDLERLGKVTVFSDRDFKRIKVEANIFKLVVPGFMKVTAKDGHLISVPISDPSLFIPKMTPATKACFQQLL